MKYQIDTSVFTPAKAVGMISGSLDFAALPRIGETIAFGFGKSSDLKPLPGKLMLQLHVTHVIHHAGDANITLVLEDLTLDSVEEARQVMAHCEVAHGLFADFWDDEQPPKAQP